MKTIVCPVDFSETANNAVVYAAQVANKLGAELVLAHAQHVPVVDTQGSVSALKDLMEDKQKEASRKLDMLIDQVSGLTSGKVSTYQTFGLVVDMIKEMDQESSIFLVVMGTKGEANVLDNWVGTTTTDVMTRCELPMIIVPNDCEFNGWERVGFSTDFTTETDAGILDVKEFLKPFDAKLSVVHVSNQKVDTEELMAIVKHFGSSVSVDTIIGSNVAIELNDYVWEKDLQLLVLKRHKRNFFDKLFHKSVSREIALSSDMPILIF